ncbi:MAG TPA: hypothetical protein VFO12_04905 [Sphingomicrobium sp.]|nr:hypothetical protein [Sphingomicrobium sp.]
MNAPGPINSLDEAHRRATADGNQWRGRLINLYARAEGRISDALHRVEPDRTLPLLLSQKISRLKKLSTDPLLIEELAKLEGRLGERNSLVHGEGKIWIDPNGEWLLQLSQRRRAGDVQHMLQSDTVKSCHAELHKLVQRLASKLKA